MHKNHQPNRLFNASRWRDKTKRFVTKHFSNPTAQILVSCGLTPNKVTMAGGLLSIAAGVLAWLDHFYSAGGLILASGFLDLIDGAMARLTGKQSKFGAVLDATVDRIGEFALLFGLVALYSTRGDTHWVLLAFAAMFGSVLVSYIKARAEGEGINCNVGIFTRGERVILIGIGLLVDQIPIVLIILTALSYLTAVQRLWQVKKSAI